MGLPGLPVAWSARASGRFSTMGTRSLRASVRIWRAFSSMAFAMTIGAAS